MVQRLSPEWFLSPIAWKGYFAQKYKKKKKIVQMQ